MPITKQVARALIGTWILGATALSLGAAEQAGFKYDVPKNWKETRKADAGPGARHEEPKGRAALLAVKVKGERLEDALIHLIKDMGDDLKNVRLEKVTYCDKDKPLAKKKDRKKKKKKKHKKKKHKKKKKKDDRRASEFCKQPTLWGKANAEDKRGQKLSLRFVAVERGGKVLLLVGASEKKFAKEKKNDKRMKRALRSVR